MLESEPEGKRVHRGREGQREADSHIHVSSTVRAPSILLHSLSYTYMQDPDLDAEGTTESEAECGTPREIFHAYDRNGVKSSREGCTVHADEANPRLWVTSGKTR
jgi:hypothetical protein